MGVISLLCWPITGLTSFHSMLISKGRTTNEQVGEWSDEWEVNEWEVDEWEVDGWKEDEGKIDGKRMKPTSSTAPHHQPHQQHHNANNTGDWKVKEFGRCVQPGLLYQLVLDSVWSQVAQVAGVVWCGVVWCGVVWCGVVWCGVVWCGVV